MIKGFRRNAPPAAALIATLFLAISAGGCVAKERHTATLAYTLAPRQPLPEGLKTVAVLDSGVQTVGAQQDDREKKWSTIAADMLEAMFQASQAQFGTGLAVAKRRDTARILMEQDLRLAGLVEGADAVRVGRLLAVQGLITSRITVRIDIQKGTKSTVDWFSLMGGFLNARQEPRRVVPRQGPTRVYRDPRYVRDPRSAYDPRYLPRQPVRQEVTGGGGVAIKTRDIEEISRLLTVQCSFSLIDAATGQALAQYSPPPYQKKNKTSPHFLFGNTVSEADLDPVDHFIGELVERGTQEFAGMLVPMRVEYRYELVGRGKDGEAGIRLLRADDLQGAVQRFDAELRRKPDEHEVVFAMGVTYELMGKLEQALECYRRAAATRGVDDKELAVYLAAKERLTEHMPRIRPATPPPNAAMPGSAATAPTSGPSAIIGTAPPPELVSPQPSAREAPQTNERTGWTWSVATQPTTYPAEQ